ncbi:type I-C CRISPR-associated protein Cas8c/Csd1 [Anoxybacillus ayderensis]|uniref:type I-C CRISPR-associated protein Cas8c/Csd1 n=1 Tax=Anoxybacillus ayderensis TaxID=265546 RepID=UPI000A26DCD8|nr:type I-C CRISPR-associated protein Cas8c/Csd1 [Anoxybacillus ayderensis]OSX53498.1 type I-C CRISPR-associated protein Cas8c/Csd1 [Anoxybacillus ayderensis]
MLYSLIELATRLQGEKRLPPICYKPKSINWIIDLSGDKPYLKGRFTKDEHRLVEAPFRLRQGKITRDNVKPYLLVDDARYVLGIPENSQKVDEAKLMHTGYVELIKEAYEKTKMEELKKVLNFLHSPEKNSFHDQIGAKDIVTFQVDEESFICEKLEIQTFWAKYLATELLSDDECDCSVCGNRSTYVRYLPNPVQLFGQSCQLTSFNSSSFESMGKTQTNNVPICFRCATLVVDTLNYLIREGKHHTLLYVNDRNILRSQIAVYWIEDRFVGKEEGGFQIDEKIIACPIEQWLFDEETNKPAPPPELRQLEELIALPKTGREQALYLDSAFFHMAVLSANKARLVVREWIRTSISQLLLYLERYTTALRIVQPNGEKGYLLPLATLIRAIDMSPSLVRQCLRMIYQGALPPNELLSLALQRFRSPKVLNDVKETWRYQALASLLKLSLTYGKEEANTMESLNTNYSQPPYICGRLLAVLEEIQQRASGYRIGSTIVDRFYGAASTAPASAFGSLLRLSTTAHLPKVSVELSRLLEEIMKQLDEAGGFPTILNLRQQAEFALGFYHQRAEFSNRRQKKSTE